MDRFLTEQIIHCPACGEELTILLDPSAGSQQYIEDCQVCCRPMQITLKADAGEVEQVQVDSAS